MLPPLPPHQAHPLAKSVELRLGWLYAAQERQVRPPAALQPVEPDLAPAQSAREVRLKQGELRGPAMSRLHMRPIHG